MELRPGYKLTEVGVIPEDWDVSTVASLAEIRSGGTPSTSRPEFWDGGVPWCTPTDITALRGRRFLVNTSRTISHAGLIASSAELIPSASIIMTSRATIGECAINVTPITTNQGFKNLTPNSNIDHAFFYYLITSQKHALRLLAAGSTFLEIGKRELSGFVLASPSNKIEQSAIATALSDADSLIESLEDLIAKKRQIKQGAMQELLTGKRRLPGFSGAWEVKQIGQVTDCTSGGTPSTTVSRYWGGSIRWMSSGELNLKMISEVEGRITEAGHQNSSAKMVPANCVLVGLAGQGKTRGTVAMNLVPLCTNQSIASIFPNSSFVPKYLYYHLDSRYEELRDLSTGEGGRGGLNLKIIRAVRVPFPALPEQSAIATVLSDMDAELDALTAKLAKARQIKQGMMQELLTGRIRLI